MLRWIVWMSVSAWPHPLSVWSRLPTSYWNMVTCHEGEIRVTGTSWPHPLKVGICWDWLSECLEVFGRKVQASMQTGNPSLYLYVNDLWCERFCLVGVSVVFGKEADKIHFPARTKRNDQPLNILGTSALEFCKSCIMEKMATQISKQNFLLGI